MRKSRCENGAEAQTAEMAGYLSLGWKSGGGCPFKALGGGLREVRAAALGGWVGLGWVV